MTKLRAQIIIDDPGAQELRDLTGIHDKNEVTQISSEFFGTALEIAGWLRNIAIGIELELHSSGE